MGFYEIRVKGHLDDRRMRLFAGMAMTPLPNGETMLFGPVVDQAALHAVLSRIRDLGLPLISVQRKDSEMNRAS